MDDPQDDFSEDEAGEEEAEDDERHHSLMAAMSKLAPKGRSKSLLRSEPGAVSEFGLSSSADGGGVELKSLLRSLDKTPAKADLNTQLKSLIRKKKALDVPLYSHEAEKIQRKVAYQKVSDDIGKWDDVVKTNRKAEHTSFPLRQNKVALQTTEEFVKRFKPSTPLEEEIYKVLNGNKYAETKDKELTRAEEEVLSAMSLEKAQLRRAELQKVRALQSYYESKCKRQKRIKSKSYRRIKRKARAKQDLKRMEEMMKTDPEAAAEELVKQERIRAEERMSLRHKNTGKWAKGMIRFGKYSEEARNKIADQLEENRALTQKIAALGDSDEDEAREGVNRPQPAGTVSLSDINNPWFTGEAPSKEKAGNEERGESKEDGGPEFTRPHPVVAERWTKVSRAREDLAEGNGSDGEIDGELKRLQARRRMRSSKKDGRREESLLDLPSEDSDMEDNDGNLSHDDEMGGERGSKRRGARGGDKDISARGSKERSGTNKEHEEEMVNLEEGLIDEDTTRRTTEEDFDAIEEIEEGGRGQPSQPDDQEEILKKNQSRVKKRKKGNEGWQDAAIDPGKVFMLKPKEVMTVAPEMVEEGDGIRQSEHLMNIQEAFEDDDVVDDFREEKESAIEKGKPKPVDLTLPGWGSWGGAGIKISEKKRKRFTIPAAPAPPRKDDGLHHVIISEDRERKLAQHQVNTLPFPFSTVEQFQSSIRAPIGKTWNTPSAVAKLTMPNYTTKRGTIIEPIQEEVLKKDAATPKQGLPKPDIDLSSEPDDKKGKKKRGGRKTKRKSQGKN